MTSVPTPQLRRLLLGQLSAAETAVLEEKILLEEGIAESLREEEFDLFDDYVKHRLSPVDRSCMEHHVLTTPERLLTLRLAQGLAAPGLKPIAAPRSTRGVWRTKRALIPMTALLAAGIAAVLVLPKGLIDIDRPQATVRHRAASPVAPAAAQTVVLLMDTERGGAPAIVHLASGNLLIQAEVPDSPAGRRYSIRIADAQGRQLFEGAHLTPRTAGPYHFVEVRVPAEVLGPGNRTVSLRLDAGSASAAPVFSWRTDTQ